MTLLLSAGALSSPAPISASGSASGSAAEPLVEVVRVGGELVCNVEADEVYAYELLSELSLQLERPIDGTETLQRAGSVTVELSERPVDQAIHFILGACGLRGRLTSSAIVVSRDYGPEADVEVLEDAAELAYLRALRKAPRSPDAPRTELELARIQERRSNLAAAHGHYELLVQDHPGSELVPYALFRSGLLLTEMGRWGEAYIEFSNLLNLEREHEYAVPARLWLARSSIEVGDPQRALYVMDALDAALPALDSADLAERLRIRALCHERLDKPLETLRMIDQAERLEGETNESLELRALALEDNDEPGQAVRAWLVLAERSSGTQLARAYANAARLAYELGDDLGVLFVARKAAERGNESSSSPWVRKARERMGLTPRELSEQTPQTELEHAESLWHEGLHQQAFEASRLLLAPSVEIDEAQRLRASEVCARSADALGRLEDGIAVLRVALELVIDPERRKRIYIIGAELYEGRGRFEDAIDAYEGRL